MTASACRSTPSGLDRGKFIWPSASQGAVSISAAQMAYMLEGIDWRNPQLTWRPKSAG
jgi:transposase